MSEKDKVAIYCRLSKDDEQSGDSVSIETQKMMLTKYCIEHDFDIFDIYIDDGYSGLNFNRPSFKRLIQDLEDGQFNIVITKDLSRLGRDYIQTGYYIDVYFVTKRVRYIAINDGIDTQNENNDIAPFKNILNDMYARDLSRKIKSAKQQRAQNGFYISGQPPYGYKVNPYNRNQLIIDDESAQIVRLIFKLAEEVDSYSEISRILEAKKIISPSVYKVMNGDTRFLKYTESQSQVYKWAYQTVRSIIKNRVYVGDMVNHKVETVNYKTKERVMVPIEDQIVVQNTHEAIIDRNIFEAINKKFSNRRKANHNFENIFKGCVFCAECGSQMQLISAQSKPMFRCVQHFKDKQICSHNHYIYYEELVTKIKDQLNVIFSEYINSDEFIMLCEMIEVAIFSRVIEKRKNKLQSDLLTLSKQIKEYYRISPRCITDHTKKHEFDDLLEKQKITIRKITEINTTSLDFVDKNLIMDQIKKEVEKCLFNFVLSENSIKHLFKRIEIGYLEKTSNVICQKIILYYRF